MAIAGHRCDRSRELNATGDIEMLNAARFALLVHNYDADRSALAAAAAGGWTVASMRQDFTTLLARLPPSIDHGVNRTRLPALPGASGRTYCHCMGDNDNDNDTPADKLVEAIEAGHGKDAVRDEPDSLDEAISKPDPE